MAILLGDRTYLLDPIRKCPAQPHDYFEIRIVDEETGRGVPLVELRTTNELKFYSDSTGLIALQEPGLEGREVYFHIKSHGYEFPADGFGYRGKKLEVKAGGTAELKLKRINVAERLYRVTGEGIYRDTVLLGHPAPIEHPVVNSQVTGQDSVLGVPYRGKIFWVWGDTSQLGYPLGNFGVAGATSDWPPPRGNGLDPRVGINLRYFVNEAGFSRPMIPAEAISGPGPKWLGGLATVRDEGGAERLIAKYIRVKDLGETLERGLVVFNDESQSFERLTQFDLNAPLYLDGHPIRASVNGTDYFYCGYAAPYATRVVADMKRVADPSAYEGFSPLVAGSRYAKGATKLDRTADGRLNYAWKRDTPPLGHDEQEELIRTGKMKRDEAWLTLEDIETGKGIKPHAGSVRWNEYRQRWIMIVQQAMGSSNLGEIWYAESDTPVGPWVFARKVVTHDKYTLYNPVHHAFFDQEDGRVIYFEGTYSDLFAGSPEKTPRYDYNQIMYRLSLSDQRLFLPVPVYEVREPRGTQYLLREGIESQKRWQAVDRVAFFAMASDRRGAGLIPIYAQNEGPGDRLVAKPANADGTTSEPLFYALPPSSTSDSSPSVVPLYEYRATNNAQKKAPVYSTSPSLPDKTLVRSAEPICRVWRNPTSLPILDGGVRPAGGG